MNVMWKDPIVEEVRARREAYAKQFGYDLEAIHRDIKERENKAGRTLVSFPPRRTVPSGRKLPANAKENGLTCGSE